MAINHLKMETNHHTEDIRIKILEKASLQEMTTDMDMDMDMGTGTGMDTDMDMGTGTGMGMGMGTVMETGTKVTKNISVVFTLVITGNLHLSPRGTARPLGYLS